MEYLDGQTLEQLQKQKGAIEWHRAVAIFFQICDALSFAHGSGVIHRDLKPQNIMLLNHPFPDFVKILDFGLSKMSVAGETVQKLTATGAMIGSISYMSPELCYGRKADMRSDIYSLGCLMYETLTGAPPFEIDSPIAVIDKHINAMPNRFLCVLLQKDKTFPPELEKIVFKAMQKAPEDRFQTMSDLKHALESTLTGHANELSFANLKMGGNATQQRKPAVLVVLVLILLGAVVIAQMTLRGGALSNKGEILSDFGGRVAQQAKAKQYLIDAETLKAGGKNHQAEMALRKAILGIGRKEPANQRNFSKALTDIDLLERIGRDLAGLRPETVFPEIKALEFAAYNDREFLHKEKLLKFSRALTRIFDFYQSSGDGLLWFMESAKTAAELKQLDELELIVAEHKLYDKQHALRLTGDFGVRQAVFSSLADGYVSSLKGDKSTAERDFDLARKFCGQRSEMSITQHCDALFEIAWAEVFNGNDKMAERDLESAWLLVRDLRKEYPELLKRCAEFLIRQRKSMNLPIPNELLPPEEKSQAYSANESGNMNAFRSLLENHSN
jgi:hypothetical protein